MAITRAQQARQMYKKGSKKPVEQAGVMNYMPSEMVTVPKIAKSSPTTPTAKLAYITPEEQDILIDLNLYGSLDGKPNRGPGGIPSLEGDFGSPTGQVDTSPGSFSGPGGSYGGAGPDVSGRRDTGTGNYQKSDRPDDVAARKEYEKNRRQREKDSKKIEDEFKKDARATRKEMRKKLSDDKKRRQARVLGILSRAKSYVDPITGETVPLNEFGLTDEERAELLSVSNITGIGPKTELQKSLVDNLLEKSDKFSGANVETFKERFDTPDMPGILGMGLKLFEGPLKKGSRKTKDFFTDDVLEAGKFKYKGQVVTPGLFEALSPAEMQEVYGDYMDRRMGGDIDAYGNPIMKQDDGGSDPILPLPINQDPTDPTDPVDPRSNFYGLTPRIAGSIFDFSKLANGGRAGMMDGGIMNNDVIGGMMDGNMDEMGRQMYGLGKLVKKATRAVKKIVKSPIGKAALLYGVGAMGGSFGNTGKFFSKGMFNPGNIGRGLFGISAKGQALRGFPELAAKKGLFGKLGLTGGYGGLIPTVKGGITLAGILPFLFKGEDEDEFDIEEYYKQGKIANVPLNKRIAGSEFYSPAADGGLMRAGYQEGGDAEPVAKKTMPLIDMDGMEKDYRETGGFVEMGRMERADDVPARLSKNEFVFTADAVRNAGDGDIDKGAEVMYNMMKNLEDGGDVSEESQGLEGARNMFQTSQRLGEVL